MKRYDNTTPKSLSLHVAEYAFGALLAGLAFTFFAWGVSIIVEVCK